MSLLHSTVVIEDPRRFMGIRAAVTTTNRRERGRESEKGWGRERGRDAVRERISILITSE
jgi:hypothetical protein